jgi:hypothetical protein
MVNLIKWFKDRTFISAAIIAIVAVLLGFLTAHYISWGWLITLFIGAIGALAIRRILVGKFKEISKDNEIEI